MQRVCEISKDVGAFHDMRPLACTKLQEKSGETVMHCEDLSKEMDSVQRFEPFHMRDAAGIFSKCQKITLLTIAVFSIRMG